MGAGEWAALAAAFIWTCSSLLWCRIHLPALELNLAKNIVGCAGLLLFIVVSSVAGNQPLFSATLHAWLWLGASSLVGIAVGDTLFFRSIQILGPRIALLLATSAPLFAVALGWIFLSQSVSTTTAAGITLTISGIGIAVALRKRADESPGLLPGSPTAGILMGLGAAFCQAAGGTLSTIGMRESGSLEGTFIRLVIAFIFTLLAVAAGQQLRGAFDKMLKWNILRMLVPAAMLGTCIGIWLAQFSFKHSPIALATTFQATSPLFAIPVVYVLFGQKTNWLSIASTAVAIVGIYLAANGNSIR